MSEYKQLIYTAAEIDERLGRGDKLSNPNLLINPFFQINQRGQSSYSGNGYGFDGWRGTRATSVIKINADGSVTVSGAIKEDGILQKLESAYAGQTLTASVEVTSITGTGQLYVRNATTWATFGSTSLENSGLHVLTVTIPPDNTDPIAIYMDFSPSATEANSMTIAPPIKIEKGEISTLANDAPPKIATDLAECQRYYLQGSSLVCAGTTTGSSTFVICAIPTPVTMRTIPTLTYGNCHIRIGGKLISNATLGSMSVQPNSVRVAFTLPAAEAVHTPVSVEFVDFKLSAEL